MSEKHSQLDAAALTETRLSGEEIFEGKILHVQRDVVRLPNGAVPLPGQRDYHRDSGGQTG